MTMVLPRISEKHVSVAVAPEQYTAVGLTLLQAMEVTALRRLSKLLFILLLLVILYLLQPPILLLLHPTVVSGCSWQGSIHRASEGTCGRGGKKK